MPVWGRWKMKLRQLRPMLWYFLPNPSIRIGGSKYLLAYLRHLFSCQWDQLFRYSRRSFPLKQGRSETKIDCQCNFWMTCWPVEGKLSGYTNITRIDAMLVVRTSTHLYVQERGYPSEENSEDSLLKQQHQKHFKVVQNFYYIVTIHLKGEERRSRSVMSRMIIHWNNFV